MIVPELPLPKYDSKLSLLKQKLINKKGIFLKRPSELNPQLNQEMDSIIQKATAYDPEERYATCRDFKNYLERYQEQYLEEKIERL